MLLSDTSIVKALDAGSIVIRPYSIDDLQPASYDVHIGKIRVMQSQAHGMTFRVDDPSRILLLSDYDLHPGDFILAGLLEHVEIDNTLACKIEGISTLGRQGITIHATSGFVDPGWKGILTLEIANISKKSFKLVSGMRIAQLVFHQLSEPTSQIYAGRYQGAAAVEGAK